MAEITAKMVKDLREKTDLPMMECKQALTEVDGDFDAALEWLRKKHKGKMSERSDRATGEGRIGVYIADDGKTGGIVELQCETAPVAKNELFIALAEQIAKAVTLGSEKAPNPAELLKDRDIDASYTDTYGKMRETMNLARCRRVAGEHLASYVHHDGKSGVLLALDAAPKSDKKVAADLCMHALFTNPVAIDRSCVPADSVERVRTEARELAKAEGKPEQIVDKIVNGKVEAFYAERVLMEQLHVKTDDYGKKKVGDILKQAGVNAITDLVIFKVGA